MKLLSPIVALIAGSLSVLAFAPFGYWWILLLALAVLFAISDGVTPRCGFLLGWLFGLGYFAFGVSWVFNSLYNFGDAPYVVAMGLTVCMVVCLALFPALGIWLQSKLRTKYKAPGFMAPLVFSSSWIFFEWVRSWFLTGFTWLSVGQSLPDSFLSVWIPVIGSLGAGFILIWLATLSAAFVLNRSRWDAVLCVFVIVLTSWFLQSYEWVQPSQREPVVATLVQGNVEHEMKWDRSRLSEIITRYVQLSLEHPDSDIFLWPETAIPTYYRYVEKNLLPQLQSIMGEVDAELISGIFAYDDNQQKIHNSLVVIGGDEQFYHKRHLVPFGEYMPFRWVLNFLHGFIKIPMSDLSPGQGEPWLQVKGVQIGPTICFEAIFSNEVASSLPNAELLANVTNDAWFGDSLAPHQHLQIAQVRSLETGRWMMRAANNGISAFIDHRGRIVSRTPQFEIATLEEEVIPMQGKTPFIIWKNYLIVAVVILALLIMPLTGSRK